MHNTLLEDLLTHFKTLDALRNLVLNNDKALFTFMLELSHHKEAYKKRFFTPLDSTLIFDRETFLTFLDTHILDKSYTTYANKIGLSDKAKTFLTTQSHIVLNYPFKDCVFLGRQRHDKIKDKNKSKKAKSEEIFLNEILARDEIDVLFDTKALCSFELVGQKTQNLNADSINKNDYQNAQINQSINQSINRGLRRV